MLSPDQLTPDASGKDTIQVIISLPIVYLTPALTNCLDVVRGDSEQHYRANTESRQPIALLWGLFWRYDTHTVHFVQGIIGSGFLAGEGALQALRGSTVGVGTDIGK